MKRERRGERLSGSGSQAPHGDHGEGRIAEYLGKALGVGVSCLTSSLPRAVRAPRELQEGELPRTASERSREVLSARGIAALIRDHGRG